MYQCITKDQSNHKNGDTRQRCYSDQALLVYPFTAQITTLNRATHFFAAFMDVMCQTRVLAMILTKKRNPKKD